MNRIEREKKVIRQMIEIFCRKHHKTDNLCNDCQVLLTYAVNRLEHCPRGSSKTSCRKCTIHCYAPAQKEKIRAVMRFVGPRMIFIHPVSAIRHLISELK
ncbi:MAG: nitrous oxide-stimulated promoter family protein [Muribaculaceae bacterium]|nr:nitrous oxide-stimulated promoter family protein [Muribaculaceae bacterium]